MVRFFGVLKYFRYLLVLHGITWYTRVYYMSVSVSIKVRREVVELADRMVGLGLARSRSEAINIMIEKGIGKVREEVLFMERVLSIVDEYLARDYKLRHGGLNALLREDRRSR